MEGRVELIDGVSFRLTSGTGHRVLTDGPADEGGKNAGMRPMEMLLLGMGGCTAFDVAQILRKRRRDPEVLEIDLDAERAEQPPKVFTRIHLKYRVKGVGITEQEVRRAIELSLDKYCSATRMLAQTAEISFEFRVL